MTDRRLFDLKKLSVHVLHVKDRADRRKNVDTCLTLCDLPNALITHAFPAENRLVSGGMSYGTLCELAGVAEPFVPTLILEDDVLPTEQYRSQFELPADADAVYLGISNCSISSECDSYVYGVSYNDVPGWSNVKQVYNMLAMHALLLCSRRFAFFCARACTYAVAHTALGKEMVWDVPVARRLSRFKVYAFDAPFFYQNGAVGGNERSTRLKLSDAVRYKMSPNEPSHWRVFECFDYTVDQEKRQYRSPRL